MKTIRELGQGLEAVVVLSEEAGNPLALKISKSDAFVANLQRESDILSSFSHPNIIGLIMPYQEIDVITEGNSHCKPLIGLEYSELGNIFEYIFTSKKALPIGIAKYYCLQLVNALSAIQEKKLVHQDLKLENFLLFDQGKTIKIADFGMFVDLSPQHKKSSPELSKSRLAGTISYMAPENHGAKSSFASDIFSLMVSTFIMVYGFAPFGSAKATDKYYKMIMMNTPLEYNKAIKRIAESLDTEFMDLFLKCVLFQPDKRLSIDAIKAHPWLNSGIATAEDVVHYISNSNPRVNKCPDKLCS